MLARSACNAGHVQGPASGLPVASNVLCHAFLQVSEHDKQQQAATAAKLNDLAAAVADVAAHAEEQAAKQAAAKQAADKVRQERQQQVSTAFNAQHTVSVQPVVQPAGLAGCKIASARQVSLEV